MKNSQEYTGCLRVDYAEAASYWESIHSSNVTSFVLLSGWIRYLSELGAQDCGW